MTSSSYRQVNGILWKELKRLHRRALIPIGGRLAETPETGLQLSDGREIVGFSTNEPEKMAGISGSELLFIADEASGIEEQIFEAIEGNRAGGARLAMFSNPTRTSGYFFDAFHSKRDFWKTIHVSSEETPNVTEGRIVIPGLATREWVEEKRLEWGPEYEASPLYRVRVRGEFPSQSADSVIGLSLVDAATKRWATTEGVGRLELGVDVAEFGDDETVIYPRRGLKLYQPTVLQSMDAVDVAGKVLEVVKQHRNSSEHNERTRPIVKVDVIGVGSGVAAVLERSKEVSVIRVNSSRRASNEDEYHNLRAELWGRMRDFLKAGGAIPPDPKLETELVAPTYSFDAKARMVVEAKERFKKRLGRSPDRADAAALAIHSEEPYSADMERFAGFRSRDLSGTGSMESAGRPASHAMDLDHIKRTGRW